MLKKGSEVKWKNSTKSYFYQIKRVSGEEPIIISLYYEKYFLFFSFSFEQTIATMVLQKNIKGYEQPITFFSRGLHDVELKYNIMEKQVFSLVKDLKEFHDYVLHYKVIVFIPHVVVKDILG